MFGLFKKKSPIEKLEEKHRKLLEEAFQLSTRDRKASDLKHAEAAEVEAEIEKLRAEKE